MFRIIEDFLPVWAYESEATLKIFKNIPDDVLHKNISGYDRTLGIMAWHIVTSISQMSKKVGLNIYPIDEKSEPPKDITIVIEEYKKVAESLAKEVKEKWTDADLLTEKEMFGEMWKNGNTLSIIMGHQAHHRAQMTVVMRILGLKVPGVYGPSKEEWSQFGMEPQK
jgi:uncharacterized damage-inducible protein DinB